MRTTVIKWFVIVCLVCGGGGAGIAKDTALKGTVYVYSEGKQKPSPAVGYEVKIYDTGKGKWSSPSVTDSYGRYALYGMPRSKFLLTVGKAGAYWYHTVWQEEVSAPGSIRPIVLPQTADIIPHASFVEQKEKKNIYDFTLWLDVPEGRKDRIRRVVYLFNNPTFRQKEYESNRANDGYKVSYAGWGCLEKVIIRIEQARASSIIDFNMCTALKAQKR